MILKKKKATKRKSGGGRGELNWVNPPNPWVMSWDMDNPIKKNEENHEAFFFKKSMLSNEIEKENKSIKKKPVYAHKTYDPNHLIRNIKPVKTMKLKSQKNQMSNDEIKKTLNHKKKL